MSEDDTTIRPSTGAVWTVPSQFLVSLPDGWTPACAVHLPVLVRRSFRSHVMPMIRPCYENVPCTVQDPHPDPHIRYLPEGYGCPRPLTGPCRDASCDHD